MAVSGGMDSMVMLHLFREAGFSIAVAHCNFQLRGNESDEDENFVAAKCKKWSIPFHSIRFDTNNYATQHRLSIQMAARELRYDWFNALIKQHSLDWIATAHHLTDSVETVLLNLTKGTSLDGLLGIAKKNGRVIRPLLFATQSELQSYAATVGIAWREDESNQTDDYQRNFIRHRVTPTLKEINPALTETTEKTIEKLTGSAHIVAHTIANWKKLFCTLDGGKILLAKTGFDHSLGLLYNTALLWEVVKEFGFHFDQCKSIVVAINGQPGKLFFSTGHQLVIDRKHLIVSKKKSDLEDVVIEIDQTEATMGNNILSLASSAHFVQFDQSPRIALLDKDLLKFPLTWRRWKAGDSFFPLGMTNRKKVSDFLIDQKVSMADKNSVTVLESAGEIVWVAAHRIDNRYKVTEQTKSILIVEIGGE